ncbi:ribonuclease H-like YkuK family protein [Candidatus Bipolaricaulota bacterium]|nr:ribonuclease H-like YkuK family protein [Candidatus Bipolaricaulota bacterium]
MLDQTFHNPSIGEMTFDDVISTIVSEMADGSKEQFELLIGTDSSTSNNNLDLVSAIVLHKIGRGGRYFWTRKRERRTPSLRHQIWREAWLSFELAQHVIQGLESKSFLQFNLEIHVDIGENGPTKELIDEVVGMIIGNGLAVRIKPHAFAASAVADKHT